jgi:hypothetical protein
MSGHGLDNRLKRIERHVRPPAHPLLDDPAVLALAAKMAQVLPLGQLMLDCIAARDAEGLRQHLAAWEDVRRTLERLRAQQNLVGCTHMT